MKTSPKSSAIISFHACKPLFRFLLLPLTNCLLQSILSVANPSCIYVFDIAKTDGTGIEPARN